MEIKVGRAEEERKVGRERGGKYKNGLKERRKGVGE